MIFVVKSIINISVDTDLVNIAHERGINVSGILNEYLEKYLMSKIEDNSEPLEEELRKKEIEIEALRSKIELSKKTEENIIKLEDRKQKLDKTYDMVVDIIIKNQSKVWGKYIKGYQNLIRTQTSLTIDPQTLRTEIEKRLKEKAPELLL